MTAESKKSQAGTEFHLTLARKFIYGALLLLISTLVVPLSPRFQGPGGTFLFILFGMALGVFTWFTSAGWTYKLELTSHEIKIRDGQRETIVPLDRLGLVARNGKVPFLPSVWLVLRGAEVGQEIPTKGIDPQTRELVEALQKRNPGKKITYVPVPGAYLRSITGLASELKRRIPPLTVDDRLGGK